jgi:hypothetical protein
VIEADGRRRPDAKRGAFACIKAHLLYRRLHAALFLTPDHAGAGRARSRAISDRISANICRGTATSAVWNVT